MWNESIYVVCNYQSKYFLILVFVGRAGWRGYVYVICISYLILEWCILCYYMLCVIIDIFFPARGVWLPRYIHIFSLLRGLYFLHEALCTEYIICVIWLYIRRNLGNVENFMIFYLRQYILSWVAVYIWNRCATFALYVQCEYICFNYAQYFIIHYISHDKENYYKRTTNI